MGCERVTPGERFNPGEGLQPGKQLSSGEWLILEWIDWNHNDNTREKMKHNMAKRIAEMKKRRKLIVVTLCDDSDVSLKIRLLILLCKTNYTIVYN